MFSGPVGSTIGQQPFRDGAVVREAQPAQWGWTPHYGRARGARADGPQPALDGRGVDGRAGGRAGRAAREICIFEVFGDALDAEGGPTAAVGMGVHPFRDPAITDEFAAPRLAIDVGEPHVYAADWRPGRVDFLVDGEHVKTVDQAPDYPMQMMVAVFDFPDKAGAGRSRTTCRSSPSTTSAAGRSRGLDEVPAVAERILEHRDGAVGLPARRPREADPGG